MTRPGPNKLLSSFVRATVEVGCDDPMHAERHPWEVVEWFRQMHNGEWLVIPEMDPFSIWRPPGARAKLDTTTNAYLGDGFTPPVTVRDRYRLQCRRCKRRGGRDVVEARADQLAQIFDALTAHGVLTDRGVSKLRLAVLASRLGRSVGR